MTSHRADTYQQITDKIVAALEHGVRPWMKPWQDGATAVMRPTRANGEAYRGINVLLLWSEAVEKGYQSPYWFTFKQAAEKGAFVRKGERSTMVVYAGKVERTDTDEDGEEVSRSIPFMKGFNVFNAEQIDGLDPIYAGRGAAPKLLGEHERQPEIAAFFANTGADIRHGGNQAYYNVVSDHVQMPQFTQFVSAVDYWATMAHEMAHWTRHSSRLDRDFGRKKWGDEGYAIEEIVAEITSAFLAADLGLSLAPRADHSAYIGSWIKVLKSDKRAIFSAAAHAQKAADFVHSLQPVVTEQQLAKAA